MMNCDHDVKVIRMERAFVGLELETQCMKYWLWIMTA